MRLSFKDWMKIHIPVMRIGGSLLFCSVAIAGAATYLITENYIDWSLGVLVAIGLIATCAIIALLLVTFMYLLYLENERINRQYNFPT